MDSANMTLLLDKGGFVKKGDMRFAVFTVGDLYVLTVDLAEDPGSKILCVLLADPQQVFISLGRRIL